MMETVITWDLETVPDTLALAKIYNTSERDARARLGKEFPKLPVHKIVCIGAVVASREEGYWKVDAIGAPHIEERPERDLIASFVARIADLEPTLVSFNGNTFDLPVLRYRALAHQLAAPGLHNKNYFNRYSSNAVDLCDVLASFTSSGKASLDVICKSVGLRGKSLDIQGSEVEAYVNQGRIKEVAEYCESDVVNTYRLWLRHELFRGALSGDNFEASERNLKSFILDRAHLSSHLASLFE